MNEDYSDCREPWDANMNELSSQVFKINIYRLIFTKGP